MTRARAIRIVSGLAAAALVALSAQLPLWSMTMRAPQYPTGLHLHAYGTDMAGDLREINILNHYIGMPPIEAPASGGASLASLAPGEQPPISSARISAKRLR